MTLAEFIALWDDDDPWEVPISEWNCRFSLKGKPENHRLLVDPVARALRPEEVLAATPPRKRPKRPFPAPSISHRIASVLRKERIRDGTGIRGLARASGLHAARLSRLERGKATMTVDDFYRVCRSMDWSMSVIIEKAMVEIIPSAANDDDDEEDELPDGWWLGRNGRQGPEGG